MKCCDGVAFKWGPWKLGGILGVFAGFSESLWRSQCGVQLEWWGSLQLLLYLTVIFITGRFYGNCLLLSAEVNRRLYEGTQSSRD